MSRSVWKIPYSYKDCSNRNALSNKALPFGGGAKLPPLEQSIALHVTPIKQQKIWLRSSMILPKHVSKEFLVHNGKNWISVKSTDEMVGHKFGEFSSTRKKTIHKFEKKKYNAIKKNKQTKQ